MKNSKIAISFNILIFGFTVLAVGMLLASFNGSNASLLQRLSVLKYYTLQSNILMAIVAIIFAFFLLLKREIPFWLSLLKFVATVAVALTLITVVVYLAPISPYGYFSLFLEYNFFLHFLTPVLSIITFVLFEKHSTLTMKHCFLGLSTMVLYAIYYSINVFSHVENGIVNPKYDWYSFVQGGIWTTAIVFPIMLIATYLISFVILKLQTKAK